MRAGYATRPRAGETHNGDAALVRTDGERTLLAVIDAVGWGPSAADAAREARAYLERAPLDAPLEALMGGLHLALRHSRGAEAVLCLLQGDAIATAGVGALQLRSVGADVPFQPAGGILGARVGTLQVRHAKLRPGQRVVLLSDGVDRHAHLGASRALPPDEAAAALLAAGALRGDDATVLVAELDTGMRRVASGAGKA